MTQEKFDVRLKRAEKELLVISPPDTNNAWRVRSAHNPSQHYLVSGDGEGLRCDCPDFESHSEDPSWNCKHMLAVQNYQAKTQDHEKREAKRESYEDAERAAIQTETVPQPEDPGLRKPQAQMLVKRSLSPDGRIDSISLEFSFDVREESAGDIKSRALKALKLQTEIVQSFLGSAKANGRGNDAVRTNGDGRNTNGTVAARMLDIGIAQTAYGERVFVNFDVSGRRARLFGSEQTVLEAIAAAGKRLGADAIAHGLMLNLPCRVITEQNGKYLNVTKVFAAGGSR
jgi:hypothetical protein